MSFLTPLFLAGLGALALPILFHLVRRTPRGLVPFSTLQFLRASPPRITRRSRLDQVLLLLLRAGALALVALAFARPFLRTAESAAVVAMPAPDLVLLVDTSASLRRDGLFARALRSAHQALDEAADAAPCLYTYHERLEEHVGPEARATLEPAVLHGLVRERLDALEPTWFATDLGAALAALADRLDGAGLAASGRRARIVVVTDLQVGTRLDALGTTTWPEGLDVEVRRVASERGNVGLQAAPEGHGAADDPTATWVRITADPAWDGAPVRLAWTRADGEGVGAEELALSVPAGEVRIVPAPPRPATSSAVRLELSGDDEPFDNVLHEAPDDTVASTVWLAGDDPADERGLAFFVRKVFENRRGERVAFLPWTAAGTDAEPGTLLIHSWRRSDEPLDVARIRGFAHAGGTAVLVLAEEADGSAASELGDGLRALLDVPALEVRESGNERGHALLARIDFGHPVFAPFDHPEYADFTRIRTWHHRRVEIPETADAPRVVARFDDGSPYWLERELGAGRVIVLTSGWHMRDSDLARSSKFAPLVLGLRALGRRTTLRVGSYHVGESIPRLDGTWRDPQGRTLAFGAPDAPAPVFERPGLYTLQEPGGTRTVAVHLAPDESRTGELDVDVLAHLAVPLTSRERRARAEERHRRESARELERGQAWWRPLVLAALALLALETLLARRIALAAAPTPNTTPR